MEKYFAPICGICTFAGFPYHEDLDTLNADAAVLGVPVDMGACLRPGTRFGPKRIREASSSNSPMIDGNYDFERDTVYLHPSECKLVDVGDVPVITGDLLGTDAYIEEYVRKIVSKGAVIAVMGGDHSVTIPVAKALDKYDDICAIQFDAHLDWADAPGGQKYCHNSPMRRMSEMDHITKMCQIGIRGLGSSRKSDFDAARAFGSVLISAREAKKLGADEIVAKIPSAKHYFITLDIDGLDAGISRGTGTPAPGGLDYDLVNDILYGIAQKGDVVGFDLVEVAPSCDPSGVTERVASTLMVNFLGYILKAKKDRS